MVRPTKRLTRADLDFLVAVAVPEVQDKARLKEIIENDEDFRDAFLGDEKTTQKVVEDKEVFLKITPKLYFEILLRRTRKDLRGTTHTMEYEGTRKIAVFDSGEVVDLLSNQTVLLYLADMLSSFTKIESYALTFRSRKGIWHRIRFNDMDLDSLIRFSQYVDEQYRFGFFKRIADICLFIPGVYPEYVQASYRYPFSGDLRPSLPGKSRRSKEDYTEEGKKFYRLAAEHPSARAFALEEVFQLLHGKFRTAQKPLNVMSENYLHSERQHLFGMTSR